MIEHEYDYHIMCDSKKKCTVFKDKAETNPVISFEAITKETDGFKDSYIQIEKLQKFEKLFVNIRKVGLGADEQTIVTTRAKLRTQQ